jgi:hypothetical protein
MAAPVSPPRHLQNETQGVFERVKSLRGNLSNQK